jgi:hypothetical protein
MRLQRDPDDHYRRIAAVREGLMPTIVGTPGDDRFHGVLVPNAKRCPEIIPSGPVNTNNTTEDHAEASPP